MVKPIYEQRIVPNCECVVSCTFTKSQKAGKVADSMCRRLPLSETVKSAILKAKKPSKKQIDDGQDFSHVAAIRAQTTGEDFSVMSAAIVASIS